MPPRTGSRPWSTLTPAEQDELRHAPEGEFAARAREIGAHYQGAWNALRRERDRGGPVEKEGGDVRRVEFCQRDDGTATAEARETIYTISDADRIRTLEDLLDRAKVDLDRWEIRSWIANAWEQHSTRRGLITLYQVKAALVPRDNWPTQALQDLINQISEYAPRYNAPEPAFTGGSYLFVPCLFDAHFGKRVLAGTTLQQSADTYIESASRLVSKVLAGGWDIDRILYPVGNDLIDADTYRETTTKGTQMQLSAYPAEVVKAVCRVQTEVIETLATLAPVDVVPVPGNHDFYSLTWLGEYLEAWFRYHDNVKIIDGMLPRKYYAWRKVLLGLTHGSEEKQNNLALVMATEAAEHWGSARCREWLTGHKHTQALLVRATVEDRGVLIRMIPALADRGSWDFLHAFTGNIQAAMGLLYHEGGAVDTITVPVT